MLGGRDPNASGLDMKRQDLTSLLLMLPASRGHWGMIYLSRAGIEILILIILAPFVISAGCPYGLLLSLTGFCEFLSGLKLKFSVVLWFHDHGDPSQCWKHPQTPGYGVLKHG